MKHRTLRGFIARHCAIYVKTNVLGTIIVAGLFQASTFGWIFWTTILSLYVTGSSFYLTIDDLLDDEAILQHFERQKSGEKAWLLQNGRKGHTDR